MKAASYLIGHSLAIGFSLLLIFIVVATLNSLGEDYRSFGGKNEIHQLCEIIKYSTEKIYNPSDYISPTTSTMGRINLVLPDKIAGIIYKASFVNGSVFITTMTKPIINTTCETNLNATLSGSTIGGETEIIWVAHPDKKDEIIMRMVNE